MKCTSRCSGVRKFAKTLVFIGALNWGLIGIGGLFGLGDWNIVHLILGGLAWLEYLVYILVGISAIIICKPCAGKCHKGKMSDMHQEKVGMNTGGMDHHDMNH